MGGDEAAEDSALAVAARAMSPRCKLRTVREVLYGPRSCQRPD